MATNKNRANRFVYDNGDLEFPEEKKEGMTIFVSQLPNSDILSIDIRAESDEMIGDANIEVAPGQSAFGLTYDELFENLGELIV